MNLIDKNNRKAWNFLWNIILIAVSVFTYLLTAHLCLHYVLKPSGIAPVWIPSGIFLSSILLSRPRLRPWLVISLFIADFISEIMAGTPAQVSLIYSLALTGDAILSAWLLQRFIDNPFTFGKVKNLIGFLLLSVVFSNAVASTLSASASALLLSAPFGFSWKWWFASSAVGNIIITPLILSWAGIFRTDRKKISLYRIIEGLIVISILTAGAFLFYNYFREKNQIISLLDFLLLPFLIWTALRLGIQGSSLVAFLLSSIFLGSLILNPVSLALQTSTDFFILAQAYVVVIATTVLFLSSVVTENNRAIKNLREQEMILHESREQFRLLAEYSPNMIFINIKGRIVYVNELCESVMGYTKEEFYSPEFSFITLIAPEYHTLLKKSFQIHMDGKENLPIEYELITKDGLRLYALLSTKLIHYQGENAILGVVTDISERKRGELQLLKQAEELRELNTSKDRFFSILAHDLKNPFQTILGFTDLLKSTLHELDHNEIRSYLSRIESSSRQVYNLLENLLLWARTQMGSIDFQPEVFNLKDQIRAIAAFAENQAGQKGIGLSNSIPDHCFILADKNMIDSILRNLVTNAIKFTARNGKISISAVKQDDHIEISVIDTGVGIPAEDIDSVFRIDRKTATLGTEKEKGSGLGLILCKEFVTKHGGQIWVESHPGGGSTFKFTIPVSG